MQFRLRTLLIVLAIGPPIVAGGYWAWDAFRPKPSPWYIDSPQYFPSGPEFKLSREAAELKRLQADREARLNGQ